MLNKHHIKVSYMIGVKLDENFTRSIEELNTGYLVKAAPARTESRILKGGVTNKLNPAFGFICQSATRPL